jgi:hypothetical protein
MWATAQIQLLLFRLGRSLTLPFQPAIWSNTSRAYEEEQSQALRDLCFNNFYKVSVLVLTFIPTV